MFLYLFIYLFCCVSPTAEEFCVVGGVCARTTKLLRVRVFSSPRLCAFSSARSFCTELTLLYLFFFCQSTLLCRGINRVSGRKPPAEAVCSERSVAGQDGHCEVSGRSHSSLLCAPTFTLQQQLPRSVCAGSFGIFDIFRIFPPSLC